MPAEYLSHPEADEEFEQAIRWYEELSYKAPADFINEFDFCIDRIIENPERHHPCYKDFRRCNMKQFPYAIIYRRSGDDVFIIAVMHVKRHPDYWKNRIEDDQL